MVFKHWCLLISKRKKIIPQVLVKCHSYFAMIQLNFHARIFLKKTFFYIDNEDQTDSALPPALYQANVAGEITHESLTNTAYQSPTQS